MTQQRCLEYTNDVASALACEHSIAALDAYLGIRRAIDTTGHMSEGALIALRKRVVRASEDYPTNVSKTDAAANTLLIAYAQYLSTVMWERDQ